MIKPNVCANCGEVYAHHMQTTQCYPDSGDRWFPKPLADALEKQARKIRKAQKDLAKRSSQNASGESK